MLNTCTGSRFARHDELVHVGAFCPACEATESRLETEEKLKEANQKLQELDSVIEDLNRQLAACEPVDVNEL